MRLHILLGDHPHTAALKSGAITSDLVELDFADYKPTNKGFKPMVRDGAFDIAEMAIVTYLMARSYDKPMVLLPDVMMARHQFGFAVTSPGAGIAGPKDLEGKRVGIRSFTTTTGAWLRGILANDYGVNLDAIEWITFEEPHVAEYVDSTTKAPAGKAIMQMLFDGELDAVLGEKSDDPRVAQLFPDVAAAEKAWLARHGVVPINHMVVVSKQLSDTRPDVVREVHRMLEASRAAAAGKSLSFDADAMNRSLALITDYSAQQGLIPRRFSVDELFDDVTRALR
ncbi:4,5-dihydroxyphthalate decarboxylase [Tardiphaga sp. OK246]|jgi:4,5-dihydroxyphthalate decarboxylase|uniref:ABC transporter substrate-binding protein n=1 Tax=Tardiphaga sp. OK246 TaxID=1855307 RepID=UPI000B741A49|nr:ABC transporter substrate-binding protein [Tardiphaga sp. OK246]SNT60150.1 4,5-dihydroxyphthalate decarboxylase [Tardiphaga sp. OK246]